MTRRLSWLRLDKLNHSFCDPLGQSSLILTLLQLGHFIGVGEKAALDQNGGTWRVSYHGIIFGLDAAILSF